MQSDLTLIDKIKSENDDQSLIELIDRHSGIYHTMVNQYLSSPRHSIDKRQAVKEKDYVIYNSAVSFDPDKKTKFS